LPRAAFGCLCIFTRDRRRFFFFDPCVICETEGFLVEVTYCCVSRRNFLRCTSVLGFWCNSDRTIAEGIVRGNERCSSVDEISFIARA
jgi:hypothetical protein